MNVLVLGGTRFVGRHIVEHLAANGNRVVAFHRGKTVCALPDSVEERFGNRDVDLSAVDSEAYDAVVDTSAYRPEQVRRSLELRTHHYLFVSTVNVYRDLSVHGINEDQPRIESFDASDEAAEYGGNKAACERLVTERYPAQSTILRPGLICGRWDYTGRFTYWCERLLRGGRLLAAGPPNRLVQFIDAADIARFAEHVLMEGLAGVFNIVGPVEATTMEQFLSECAAVAAERSAPPSEIVWADADSLLEHNVVPWTEIPLWLTDAQYAGVLAISNAKAVAAGLRTRDVKHTVRDVLDWTSVESADVKAGITSEREGELLEIYAKT